MMSETQQLMADFARTGSETAFKELVRRYTDLVYSVAIRLVNGDTQLAQDVTQTVFIDLAKMAGKLSPEVLLGGWLHRHSCFVAATLLRGEKRRRIRERQALEMKALNDQPEPAMAHLAPILDDAINQLQDEDRMAIVLRYFEKAEFRIVGQALGITDDAARMRVSRALDKLQLTLKARGVTLTAAGLGTVLAASAVTSAPAGMALGMASTTLAGLGPSSAATLLKIVTMTKLQMGIIGTVVLAGVLTPLALNHKAQIKLKEQDALMRQQADQLAELAAENSRLSNVVNRVNEPGREDPRELLKLRGEVGVLKRQIAAANSQLDQAKRQVPTRTPTDTAEEQKQVLFGKMGYTKGWMMAFAIFASKNQGQMPTNFDQAAAFLPDETRAQTNFIPDQYELMYQGSLNDLTNAQSVIVLREKDALQDPDGGAHRAYGFADGHSEIHKAVDGNFETWEQQHLVLPPNPPSGH
jgi:RNA polymerase sigma factor (sigma-70 family)